MTGTGLGGHHIQFDTAELARGSGEVLVHHALGQPHRFEGLRPAIGGDRGDAHLGHDLQHALAQRLDQVGRRLLAVHPRDLLVQGHLLHAFQGQVGVDGAGPVADQQCDVVHLAGVPGFDDQRNPGAVRTLEQVVVHRGGQQQRRDRCPACRGVAVREHQVAHTAVHRGGDLLADLLQPGAQLGFPAAGAVETAHLQGDLVARLITQVADLGQLVVGDHREVQGDLLGVDLFQAQQVAIRPDGGGH